MSENITGIEGRYYPMQPINPDEYSIKQYLFDTNTLLTQLVKDQKIIIEYLLAKVEEEQKEKEPKKLRTIGITND